MCGDGVTGLCFRIASSNVNVPSPLLSFPPLRSDKERSSMGLLFVVLSVIMLKPLTEGTVHHFAMLSW